MEELSSSAADDVDMAAEATDVQPLSNWRDIVEPAVQPQEHTRSSAAAQHASSTAAASIAEQQARQDPSAEPSLAPSLADTSSKARASSDGGESLTSVTQLGQPRDRQLPVLEVHSSSGSSEKETSSPYNSRGRLDSMQHATDNLSGGADADSAEPPPSKPANVEQAPQTLQQHNHSAARALASPTASTGTEDTHEVDHTSKQHGKQAETCLPRLQPTIPDQATSMASIAPTGKGPAEAEALRNDQQLGSTVLARPAAQAGSALMQHITDVLPMSTEQATMLQPDVGMKQTAQQQASAKEGEGPMQNSSCNTESMSAPAVRIGGVAVEDARSAAGLIGSSDAASAMRPAAAPARPPASPHSLQHAADRAVPSTSVGTGASSDSHTQLPDQQQGPSLPAHSSVGESPAQSQLPSAENALTDRDAERMRTPYEGSSIIAHTILSAPLAPCSSDAQPASSDDPHRMLHDSDARGSREEEPLPSAAQPTASAEPMHALGKEYRQGEVQDILERTGASTAPSEAALQAGSDRAMHHAESEAATQEELLALAEAVSRLEADLADAREAVAGHEHAAEAARQDAARWQDREADARVQVLLVINLAVFKHIHPFAYLGVWSPAMKVCKEACPLQTPRVWMRQQLSWG